MPGPALRLEQRRPLPDFAPPRQFLETHTLAKGDCQPKKPPATPKRKRRSTEEIIDRLMEAACEEFERSGYAGSKTAEIARKAGVAEALIFSNFGSKAKLFQDSIFKPLDRHFPRLYQHASDRRETTPTDFGWERRSIFSSFSSSSHVIHGC